MPRPAPRARELPIGSPLRTAVSRRGGVVCLAALVTIAIAGCVVREREAAVNPGSALEGKPRSIVIASVLNETTYIEAAELVEALMTRPLAERGYYVLPFILTDALGKDLGLSEPGHVHELPPARFRELFGADTVLFIVISDWGAKYWLIEHGRVVTLTFTLRDTRSGETLWASSQTVQERKDPYESKTTPDSASDVMVGVLADLISAPIAFALDEAFEPDYRPLAEQAIEQAFNTLPPGPYGKRTGVAASATPDRDATSDPLLRWLGGEP